MSHIKKHTHLATIAVAASALLIAAPIAATFLGALAGGESQSHIWTTNGVRYLTTTLLLCMVVGAGAGVIGALGAMTTVLTDFPGRRFFSVALALPFAIPAYVAAYAYADFLGPFGPAASLLGRAALPEIRTFGGAAYILTLASYPYVYLAMRASLLARSTAFMETARALGATPMTAARRVLFTAARPALIGGLALALMETMADYGVADYYGVPTLSVGIFRTWHGLGDFNAATQLAAGLFLVALFLVLLEETTRRGKVHENVKAARGVGRLKLSPAHSIIAILICAAPVLLGFIVPAGVLIAKLEPEWSVGAARGFAHALTNTAFIAAAGAVLATILALLLAYAARQKSSLAKTILLRLATFGYAIPGAVIAIGVLSLTAGLSRFSGIAVAGGVGILLYAYVARFLTASYNVTSAGLAQISPQMDAAAKSLGAGSARILREIHWPMARGAALAGGAIVAIDIAKELPATLLLRPFNFETLSTQIYRLAADERLADAAPAALTLIALGLIPTIALSFFSERNPRKNGNALAGAFR